MIGEAQPTDHLIDKMHGNEAVVPPDSPMTEGDRGRFQPTGSTDNGPDPEADTASGPAQDAEGPAPSASTQAHPLAGLFDVAIDGVATITAHFVRDRLSHIVAAATKPADPEKPPTGSAESGSPATSQRKDGLLIAVAVAAIATTVLWYLFTQKKKSGP